MPFAGYPDFDTCVRKNSDKSDPEVYCGYIKHRAEGKELTVAEKARLHLEAQEYLDTTEPDEKGFRKRVKYAFRKVGRHHVQSTIRKKAILHALERIYKPRTAIRLLRKRIL